MQHSKNRTQLIVLAGSCLTFLWELTLWAVPLGDRVVQPGMLAYVVLMFASLPAIGAAVGSRLRDVWFGAAAVVLTDLPAMATRASGLGQPIRDLVGGALIAACILLPLAAWCRQKTRRSRITVSEVLTSWFAAMAAVVVFQWFNRSARAAGVPNEERSVMLGGVELHHINWGIILIVVVVMISASIELAMLWRMLLAAVTGFGVGMILDEWFYYMARQVTDDAYFETVTWASAVGLGVLLLGVWLVGVRSAELSVPQVRS